MGECLASFHGIFPFQRNRLAVSLNNRPRKRLGYTNLNEVGVFMRIDFAS
jgi:hypothetical protein